MNNLVQIAKRLRKEMTDAEKIVWYFLQAKNVNHLKFRRQEPIGKYIVDFVCFEKKLIIEIDGGQHAENKNRDLERDTWLHTQDFTVLRFWNNEVLENRTAVLDKIIEFCK